MATKAQIIDLLIVDARTEREVGFNSALIKLLKADFRNAPRKKEDGLLKVFGSTLFGCFSKEQINALIGCKEGNQKLNAVKITKDVTGLGLRESKDFMDTWFNM